MVCPICLESDARSTARGDGSDVDCSQCGSVYVTGTAQAVMTSVPKDERWKVSAWVREYQPASFSSVDVDAARKSAVPSIHRRAHRMLRALAQQYPPSFEFRSSDAYRCIAVGWNKNGGEARFMVEEVLLNELGYLTQRPSGFYRISAKGLLALESAAPNEAARVGFCAMWFDPEVRQLWTDVVEKAVKEAGYEPLRIDGKEHNGRIDDEIMASIRSSKFVVSDFTGNRGGVYYEAGFAHGLGLPVIFMCRDGDHLHFDVRQYNCIFWSSDRLEEARDRLKNRILATLGQGPLLVQ
jgi:hypothetical protein